MKIYEGKLVSKDVRIGIVVARFNEFITSKLIGGAEDCLLRHDVKKEDITKKCSILFLLYVTLLTIP